MLGYILESIEKKPFEEVAQERIFGPLGMNDTTFYPTKEQLARLAAYHAALIKKYEAAAKRPWRDPDSDPLPEF